MKIENQCCTLEQAKILSELGLNEGSVFAWKCNEIQNVIVPCQFADWSQRFASFVGNKFYPAFTAAELIKMNAGNGGIDISCTKESKGKFYRQTDGFGESHKPVFTYYDSFAQASAAKLIDALQNDWLDVETCNKRLVD